MTWNPKDAGLEKIRPNFMVCRKAVPDTEFDKNFIQHIFYIWIKSRFCAWPRSKCQWQWKWKKMFHQLFTVSTNQVSMDLFPNTGGTVLEVDDPEKVKLFLAKWNCQRVLFQLWFCDLKFLDETLKEIIWFDRDPEWTWTFCWANQSRQRSNRSSFESRFNRATEKLHQI